VYRNSLDKKIAKLLIEAISRLLEHTISPEESESKKCYESERFSGEFSPRTQISKQIPGAFNNWPIGQVNMWLSSLHGRPFLCSQFCDCANSHWCGPSIVDEGPQ
jgi:hypothetical protein